MTEDIYRNTTHREGRKTFTSIRVHERINFIRGIVEFMRIGK
jgi:hypothetical protein